MRRTLPLFVIVAVTSFAIGGVAFASHDFSDVPDSHPFHDDISWMASTGVAEGFPDGTYRPTQPVTRQAMAAFLHRLSGDVPGAPRVVDAKTLQDRTAADFDDAVTLAGRTPADYDDAVTLNGRTPADYDNAVTLNGQTNEQLQPEVRFAHQPGELLITSFSASSPNPVLTTATFPAGTYVVDVNGAHRTTWEASTISCLLQGGDVVAPPESLTGMYAGPHDFVAAGEQFSGTAVLDLPTAGPITFACHLVAGSGSPSTDDQAFVGKVTLIATSVEDL